MHIFGLGPPSLACSGWNSHRMEQVSGHEMRTGAHCTSKLKLIFLLIFIIFFIFMHLWTAWAWLGLDAQVWNWVRKVILRNFQLLFSRMGFLLPPPFPQEEKKVSSRLPLFCLIQIFPKAFLPPLGNLKWHVRSSLSFLTWLFLISLDSSLCREDPQNT